MEVAEAEKARLPVGAIRRAKAARAMVLKAEEANKASDRAQE